MDGMGRGTCRHSFVTHPIPVYPTPAHPSPSLAYPAPTHPEPPYERCFHAHVHFYTGLPNLSGFPLAQNMASGMDRLP